MSSPLSYLYAEDLYQIPAPRLVVIIPKTWDEFMNEEKALLAKILGSVKLDVASVKMVRAEKLSLTGLTQYQASKILVFGSALDEVKSYENVVAQGFSVIKADDLSALDDAKKKSLWLALKAMFGI